MCFYVKFSSPHVSTTSQAIYSMNNSVGGYSPLKIKCLSVIAALVSKKSF